MRSGGANMMGSLQAIEVLNAIYQRRAIRRYTGEPVERETIEKLIDAAVAAPSAMNVQPWAFAVIEGAERLKAYSALAREHLVTLPGEIAEHARRLLGSGVNIFHGAPALIVLCATSAGSQAAEDCCLAAENLMLAAFAEGLGTCPIGFARPWLALDETRRELGIPQEWTPVFAVVVGFPDESPESHGRSAPQIVWSEPRG